MKLRFLFAFLAKNREWCDSYSGFLVTFGSPWLHWFHSARNNLTSVCFSDIEWENLLTLCVSCHKRRRPQAGGKKSKLVFISSRYLERRSSVTGFLTNILCRKCVDKNETLVRKLHEVRESFESSRKTIAEEKGGINLNKMACARSR